MNNANFTTDGVDAAIRNLPVDAAHDEALKVEKLLDQSLMPVCSPAFVENTGPSRRRTCSGACRSSMTTASPVAP
jgi:LysR family transcriptional regulator, glycine cleavage system transcriptional activator